MKAPSSEYLRRMRRLCASAWVVWLIPVFLASCDTQTDPATVFQGRVQDGHNGALLAGVTVSLREKGSSAALEELSTPFTGHFEFTLGDSDSPADYLLHFEAECFRSMDFPASEFEGEGRNVSLARFLPPGQKICMQFVRIESGTFVMGVDTDFSWIQDEKPEHTVHITKDFGLGRYEVTQGEWEAVMGSNPSAFRACGPDCPVENVTWDDTQVFIAKLNEAEGQTRYRLPTEAEWEYAARAGTRTCYFFGSNPDLFDEYGWCMWNSGERTHAVGHKLSNTWGLYDVLGNVCEWVQDWWAGDYYAVSPEVDPQGPSVPTGWRLCRGGSFEQDVWFEGDLNRVSFRRNGLWWETDAAHGLRIVKMLD